MRDQGAPNDSLGTILGPRRDSVKQLSWMVVPSFRPAPWRQGPTGSGRNAARPKMTQKVGAPARLTAAGAGPVAASGWRRARDSNPRPRGYPGSRLAGGCTRPLCDPSGTRSVYEASGHTAEGEGFEPPGLTPCGFQDRRIKPLCHPSWPRGARRCESILNRAGLSQGRRGWATARRLASGPTPRCRAGTPDPDTTTTSA